MSVKKLIAYFSEKVELPIPISSVVEQIRLYSILDDISFVGVSLDERKIKGAFFEYSRSPAVYAYPEFFAEVYYIETQPIEWRRFVVCKELLHLLDKKPAKSGNETEISELITSLCEGDTLNPEDEFQTWTDHLMVFYAMAILLPYNARELLLPGLSAGHLTVGDIAAMAQVPEIVVNFVMSDKWPIIHNVFNGER
jgi:hypothetical protein